MPMYRDQLKPAERLSLQRCVELLPQYPMVFMVPENLEVAAQLELAPTASVRTFPSEWFQSLRSYNAALLKPAFYEAFQDFEWILIHQLDAFLFTGDLNAWLARDIDYVGAPFWADYGRKMDEGLVAVGNGGLSLRRVHAAREVLRIGDAGLVRAARTRMKQEGRARAQLRRARRVGVAEDLFWGTGAKSLTEFRVPDCDDAVYFAFETGLDRLCPRYAERLPFGCHAQWNLDMILRLKGGAPPTDAYERCLVSLMDRAGV